MTMKTLVHLMVALSFQNRPTTKHAHPLTECTVVSQPWFNMNQQNSHWTMQLTEQDGRLLHDRYQQSGRVAAHYTPLIGPYDSRDTDTISLHMDLIALSGIDGILFKCVPWTPAHTQTFHCE
jgi:hypothetical protein